MKVLTNEGEIMGKVKDITRKTNLLTPEMFPIEVIRSEINKGETKLVEEEKDNNDIIIEPIEVHIRFKVSKKELFVDIKDFEERVAYFQQYSKQLEITVQKRNKEISIYPEAAVRRVIDQAQEIQKLTKIEIQQKEGQGGQQ